MHSWSAATRPDTRHVRHGASCPLCGRPVYVVDRGVFLRCVGCDELAQECWCPDVRVTA